jgi:hypothetical protein
MSYYRLYSPDGRRLGNVSIPEGTPIDRGFVDIVAHDPHADVVRKIRLQIHDIVGPNHPRFGFVLQLTAPEEELPPLDGWVTQGVLGGPEYDRMIDATMAEKGNRR